MTDPDAPRPMTIRRLPAVGWFSLRLLVGSGIREVVSRLIGTQTGRREILAALDGGIADHEPYHILKGDDLWIDYVADLGDGFDATHSVAWLVARDHLFLAGAGAQSAQPIPAAHDQEAPLPDPPPAHTLPRADVVIFGGDQVYPYATHDDYQDRTFGPYYAARPWGSSDPQAAEGAGSAFLFAIPGNHDWYDGLTGFIRIFCQPDRWIGWLRPRQRRSYFSLALPNNFHVWGLDLATEDDIDPPQVAFFEQQAAKLKPHDQVVICTPKPAWVECGIDDAKPDEDVEDRPVPDAWRKLGKIMSFVDRSGATIPLVVSGDLHHYAHHRTSDELRHFVTCGGGGAFALGTTMQPRTLSFEDGIRSNLMASFPAREDSLAMRKGALMVWWTHRLFCAVFAGVLLSLVWLFQSSSMLLKLIAPMQGPRHGVEKVFLDRMAEALGSPSAIPAAISDFLTIALNSPGTLTVLLAVIAGFIGFGISGARLRAPVWHGPLLGLLHFGVQFKVAVILSVVLRWLLTTLHFSGFLYSAAFIVLAIGIGLVVHGFLLGAYLWLANQFLDAHQQEVYSSQAIQDWKCFLRMKLSAQGLTVYPIGLRTVETDWQRALGEAPPPAGPMAGLARVVKRIFDGDHFDVPKGTTHLYKPSRPLLPELIEEPFVIPARLPGDIP